MDAVQISLTSFCGQDTVIPNEEVWECAMYMGAYFLTCLCGSKYANDRHFSLCHLLPVLTLFEYLRVKICVVCLIVVDAIESDPKYIHLDWQRGNLDSWDQNESIMTEEIWARSMKKTCVEIQIIASEQLEEFTLMWSTPRCGPAL